MLCKYALTERKINQLKLYIYLKASSSGCVKDNKAEYQNWADAIGVHKRTVINSLQWLIDNKWIVVNGKRNQLRIIGYDNLLKKLDITTQSGCPCKLENKKFFADFESLLFSKISNVSLYNTKRLRSV